MEKGRENVIFPLGISGLTFTAMAYNMHLKNELRTELRAEFDKRLEKIKEELKQEILQELTKLREDSVCITDWNIVLREDDKEEDT